MKKNNILQNLKSDFPAGIGVFFVALPLCLGIALASNTPIFSGIIAGIVGGILVGIFSKSQIGVSGPAAGLVTVTISYLAELNNSWPAFLTAIVLAGIIQFIFGLLKFGKIAYFFPSSVIKGMLTGIGLIIILKQIPHALGYDANFKEDFGYETIESAGFIAEISNSLNCLTPIVVIITTISMFILIFWEVVLAKKHKIFTLIQGPLVVVLFGILTYNFLPNLLNENQVVQIPVASNIKEFFQQFTMPDFEQLKNTKIYFIALAIALIASVETLLCVDATDKIDPLRRNTPTNRELKSQGIGNIISGLIGGLPITQVIVRSSANVSFGGKTKMSTIFHGLLLLVSAIAIPKILNMIPLSSLACILILVGFKLAKPSGFKQMYKLGADQFLPFIATIIVMIVADLLKGVAVGFLISIYYRNFHIKKLNVEDARINAKKRQKELSPKDIILLLKEGNKRFVTNLKNSHNLLQQVNETSGSQYPFAFILSCIDSRTSAELIFDQGLGEIFSCRIAGNILNEDILGSMEFACKIAGAKLIMVLGHKECGAINGACKNVEMGYLTNLLLKIRPAVLFEKENINKPENEKDFVNNVAETNVRLTMDQITKQSSILAEMEKSGEIAIIGGMYDVGSGVVKFY